MDQLQGGNVNSGTGKVIEVKPIKDGFLTREEFPDIYNECSKAIHTVNPFGTMINYSSLERNVPAWINKIKTLLNHHQIQLLNEKTQLWVLMQANTDGRVHAFLFERMDA